MEILLTLLLCSIAANVALLLKLNKPKKRTESYEVKELLQDLLSGSALVKVTRISPADVMLRSPRGRE